MITFTGKYTTANVMIDNIDDETVKQIINFINHEAFTNPITIMPDTHAGKGAVIGFTMKMTDKIIPEVIGVDIGCGMTSLKIGNDFKDDLKEVDKKIREHVPFGFSVRNKEHSILKNDNAFFANISKTQGKNFTYEDFKKLCKKIEIDLDRAELAMGSLGGGNHFIEIGLTPENDYWITIHTGSRNFGLKVANYWTKVAGKENLAYLEGDSAKGYLNDMVVAQNYAVRNRLMIEQIIVDILKIKKYEKIVSVHNYIDFRDKIIRKGAISSYKNELMIIPFNMEDGLLICEGQSNENWNFSAPHGAGRIASRSWAKKHLSSDEAENRMKEKGIYFSKLPLDETRGAYKDPEMIEKSIEPTAKIVYRVRPILSMKE